MNILVTGGCGYIGSHTLVELIQIGHSVIVVDNLSNSSKEALKRIEIITSQKIPLYIIDCADKAALAMVFDQNQIDAAIHFAGLKSVGESVSKSLAYYRNNIDSTLSLCEVMQDKGIKRLIFSSSATDYGTPQELPLTEQSRTGVSITNPYGQTKFMIEQILRDLSVADPEWQITLLRYFNPIGAHESGLIGEDPNDIPNNLLPFISQVAVGKLEKVRVFGDNYDTPDGTGVRDYIHVVDLARGHVAALDHLHSGINVYNLGTGRGVSVLEVIKAFEKAASKKIPCEIVGRRPGDIASCYANCSKANKELGWRAEKTFEDACADTWRWQVQNPSGYAS
jgi:UDP-glucose 4-epimerase